MEINSALRLHQLDHDEILRLLHKYLPPIIERFYGGKLPLPALSWERRGYRNLGTYYPKDGLALSHRININSFYANRPLADILRTLTHEVGHCWQHVYGKPGKRNYHNKEFQAKMDEVGIPCDRRGCSLAMQEPFVSFLKELGVEAQVISLKPGIEVSAGASRSPLAAWRCKCMRVWVWRDFSLEADCKKCQSKFQRT